MPVAGVCGLDHRTTCYPLNVCRLRKVTGAIHMSDLMILCPDPYGHLLQALTCVS